MIRHVSLYLDDGQMEKKVYSEPYFFGSFKKNGQSNEITVLTKIWKKLVLIFLSMKYTGKNIIRI